MSVFTSTMLNIVLSILCVRSSYRTVNWIDDMPLSSVVSQRNERRGVNQLEEDVIASS